MDRAKYTGTEYPELIGKRALILEHPEDDTLVLAQFDDLDLVPWAHGWHALPKRDMSLLVEVRVRIGSL
jgi:hypothetical protein